MRKAQIILWLSIALLSAGISEAQLQTRRPGGRLAPIDLRCTYQQTPWGTNCSVGTCQWYIFPMYVATDEYKTNVQVDTDQGASVVKVLEEAGRLAVDDRNYRFVEWYTWHVDKDPPAVPTYACYCDETTGVVNICVNGKFSESR